MKLINMDALLAEMPTIESEYKYARKIILEQQVIDAVPVRHGQWDYVTVVDDGFWRCSNCGTPSEALGAKYLYRYCPFCGAKMDGE